ncbi:MAG: NAD-dependent succinate-semialdehyde dehydrogenase [Cyclobacteriaceae bacterium]|nr:NAD-dependent succinate-semialdehyde dehydrogenase [Cyclobacteriaceae bacterium]
MMSTPFFQSINPFDNSTIETYGLLQDESLFAKINLARESFKLWKNTSIQERTALLKKVADILRTKKDFLSNLVTLEMGKLLSESKAEIEKCAWVCDYYSENAELFLRDEIIETEATRSYVKFEPLGPLLAIMPWNFPFWQVFRFIAPSLAAGNTILLKHAPNVCGCSLAIENLLIESGIPQGVFQSLIITHEQASKVISHDAIRGVTLTGSERAGRIIGAVAGRHLKKCVLELGGSDPFIVLEDADIEKAAEVGMQSRLFNAGQTCISAKRFIIHQSIYDSFIENCIAYFHKLKKGNPLEPQTTIAPLARKDITDTLKSQMTQAMEKGARLLQGGQTEGCYFDPAILTHINTDMEVFKEETFGPLTTILKAKNEGAAISLANASNYGLGASLWTTDLKKASLLTGKIEAGCVFVNSLVKSDPRLPFGGIKNSGHGRELAKQGIHEFSNIKTVYIS